MGVDYRCSHAFVAKEFLDGADDAMILQLRKSQHSDMPFLREMLYEAVFWRDSVKPSFEEGLAYPEVSKALADWGKRDGDTAVVATIDSIPVGAAWYRYWTDSNFTRGYLDENTPELVIGVHSDFRHQGVGTKMIEWLIDYASRHSIRRIKSQCLKRQLCNKSI